jgi:hypothetical protein
VKALFEEALTHDGEDRALFLQRSCADNPLLKQEVEDLLNSYDETDDFLDRPIASVSSLLDNDLLRPPEQDNQIGARIGAYRIEKEIGRRRYGKRLSRGACRQ